MPTLSVSRRRSILALLAASLAWTAAVGAQEPTEPAAPAHVAYVDETVTLERDGALEAAGVNMPIVAGDRLRTTAGRLELLFPDGTALDLDQDSSVDMLSPTLLRLLAGRAVLTVAGTGEPSGAVRYQIDTPVASVRADGPGEYRVAVLSSRDGETELAVVRGMANLATDRGEIAVRAGERTVASENGAPPFPQAFNSARFDAFDRWVADRRSARMASSSRQYLPRELQTYSGTLDQYGSWQYAEPYGYVWYPTVAASWRPYYYGNWSPIRSYGWTWIGADLWSWPTHHYGRWGHARDRWYWIPGRTWGPAWVSWAAAPGYVSWCPLGFDSRPVFALSIGAGNPWAGWTVVPRGSFGYRNDHVNHRAIQPHLLPRTTPFIVQSVAPVAVPRSARGQVASPELGRRMGTREGGSPAEGRPSTADGRRINADNSQPGNFARSGSVDRNPGTGERGVPRSPITENRPTASGADAPSASRDDRGTARPAASADAVSGFRQALPDRFRTPAADRTLSAGSRSVGPERPSPRNIAPSGPGRDPRLTPGDGRPSSESPASRGVGRRPGAGEVSSRQGDGSGSVEADRRWSIGAATPRYRTPEPGGPVQSAPSAGTVQRPSTFERPAPRAPVDRAPAVTTEPRGVESAPRSAPQATPPAGRAEGSAPGGGSQSHGERAVPRGDGSRGGGRQR